MRILFSLLGAILLLFAQSRPFLIYLWTTPSSLGFQTLAQLLNHLTDFGVTLIHFIGFYYIGKFILKPLKSIDPKLNHLETFIFATLLGETFCALTLFIAGNLNFFNPLFLTFFFMILSWGTFKERFFLKESILKIWEWSTSTFSWWSNLWLTLILAGMLRAIVVTATPPTDWDSLSYHLALPKIYLQAGDIFPIPWAINAHYPLNTEMIYALGMSIRGDLIPHWINLFHGLLLLLLTAQVSRKVFKLTQEGALLSVALLALQPVFQRVSGNASTDLSTALAVLSSFACLQKGLESKDKNFFFLAGAFAGAAMSSKITGIWMMSALYLTLLIFKVNWRSSFYFLFGAFLLGSPWYLKNWITLGNPLWPYLGEFFHANLKDLDSWHRIQASVTEGIPKNSWNFLTLPYQILFKSEKFLYGSLFTLLPFILLLSVRLLRKAPFEKIEKHALCFLFFTVTFWFWTYQNWRYLFPILSLLILLTVKWSTYFWKEEEIFKFLSLSVCFSLVPLFSLSINNEAFVFLNLKSKTHPRLTAQQQYLQRTLGPSYLLAEATNKICPPNAKVFLYKDVRGYYLNRDYAWGDPLNPGTFSYKDIHNTEELYKKLISLGFTHILYNPTIGNYQGDSNYYKKADEWIEELLKTKTRPLKVIEGQGLFELSKI